MKIALIGYGKMGHIVEKLASAHGMEITERFLDVHPLMLDDTTQKALEETSVLIDFSVPKAVIGNIKVCAQLSKNIVVGTTGWYSSLDEAKKVVRKSGIGLVYAPNFSLGVNLFYRIVDRAGEIFKSFENYDPYIMESHHKFKIDAPSGTALVLKQKLEEWYKKRDVSVTSVRAGYIPGSHSVGFDSTVDHVQLTHTARSREGFTEGALLSAKWVEGRKGFYEFRDVLDSMLKDSNC